MSFASLATFAASIFFRFPRNFRCVHFFSLPYLLYVYDHAAGRGRLRLTVEWPTPQASERSNWRGKSQLVVTLRPHRTPLRAPIGCHNCVNQCRRACFVIFANFCFERTNAACCIVCQLFATQDNLKHVTDTPTRTTSTSVTCFTTASLRLLRGHSISPKSTSVSPSVGGQQNE